CEVKPELVERRAGDVNFEDYIRRRMNLQVNALDTAHRRLVGDVKATVGFAAALRRLDAQRHRAAVVNVQPKLEGQKSHDHVDETRHLFVKALGTHNL